MTDLRSPKYNSHKKLWMNEAAGRDEFGTQSVINMALPGLPLGQCLAYLFDKFFLDISFPSEIQTFIVYSITVLGMK